MTIPLPPSSPHTGRLTGFVLGLVVFVCVSLIGFAGYLKYELDRAETVLMAPEARSSTDEDPTEKLRRSLGYGGFLGLAQSYTATHDPSSLTDMKAHIKIADDLMSELPEKMPTETRHDLQSIITMFDNVMQKASKASTDNTTFFTANDLMPLYAALPILDARLASAAMSNKTEAHNQLQFWAMLLTLISRCSLIIAAAMCVGIYLSLRDRNSAPLRALAQSIRNMGSGDMRTSIWGMERSDMVGELARAVDLARYTFSQMPDLSVLSEQGPLRLRFEGKTRSLFEAMMQVITRDSEQVRTQTSGLAEAITRQNEAITLISSRVEAVLHNVEKRGLDGDHQIKHVVHSLVSSAQSLKNAQEHSADQLNRIVPFLQERAQGISEIAQITGKQISQVLQNLTLTERNLKASAEQSDVAIKKISATADDLGGRLFGAVNLLQASGKVLSETTEKTQNRLNEAIGKFEQNVNMPEIHDVPAAHDVPTDVPPEQAAGEFVFASRLETVIQAFENAQQRLEQRIVQQTHAAQAQIALLSTQSSSLLSQTTTTAQTLSSAADSMREERSRFDVMMAHITAKLEAISMRLEEQSSLKDSSHEDKTANVVREELAELAEQITDIANQITIFGEATKQSSSLEGLSDKILGKIADGFGTTHQTIEQIKQSLSQLIHAANQPILPGQSNHLSERILEEIAGGFGSTSQIISHLQNQMAELAQRINATPQTNLAETITRHLDANTQLIDHIRKDISNLSVSLTGLETTPSQNLIEEVQQRWFQIAAQIEATRSDLMQAITQQISHIEAHIQDPSTSITAATDEPKDTQKQIEQQTLILTELVATLGVLDTHMQQLKSEVRAARH